MKERASEQTGGRRVVGNTYFFPFTLIYIGLLSFERKILNKYIANSFLTNLLLWRWSGWT